MNYKNSKWTKQILALQHDDGSWGHFHSLSIPTKARPLTTEQAMRRLRILGFTKDDEPISRVMRYMEENLLNTNPTVFHEKAHDSKTYGDLMLAAWLYLFDNTNELALTVVHKWVRIIEAAFSIGSYNHESYISEYEAALNVKLNPKAGCLSNFVVSYQIALLQNVLSPRTESLMLDYVLSHQNGIYYIYNKPLNILPEIFASREASHYLAAIELLSGYSQSADKLSFIAEWLMKNRDNGFWDMGTTAKDGVYYPLSDSWRNVEDRKRDYTYRMEKLLSAIG